MDIKQGVVLTGRNHTGPPCSVGRPTVHAPGGRLARPPKALQTTTYDKRQMTTTNASQQSNTGPLGGPITNENCTTNCKCYNTVFRYLYKRKVSVYTDIAYSQWLN